MKIAEVITYSSFIGLSVWVPLCVKYLPRFTYPDYIGAHRA